MKIKAAVIREKDQPFEIEEIALHEPKADEVLIKIVASGICHTDDVARSQVIPVSLPAVLGHEGSGIVEAVGSNVKEIAPGDHVVMTFASCEQCENCLEGRPYACKKFNDINFGGILKDGTSRLAKDGQSFSAFFGQSSFATYAVADRNNVVKVDKDVDLALLGPLGCGIQTGAGTVLNKLKPEFGSSIVVFGCGAVGLSAIMAARIANCSNIIAVDMNAERLELAKELGATHVLNGKEVEDVVAEIKRITNGGAHYAVETTGVPPVVNNSLYCLRSLGTVAIVGVAREVTIDLYNAILIEGKSMVGVIEGNSVPKTFIPKLIEYYKAGQFPFDKLVKFYSFEEINKGFEDSKKGIAIKPILKMN